ncbi:hypothetical protein [Nocardia amamiensis]|uniref:hypothetical protein n=1 Tax=Nocardia amamiensis TaxID=404578 RepID=UPI000832B716|nr:hypothetical protein [Nocardia amamiensis]
MDNFTVDLSSLAGFELDLQDVGTNFSSNASRLLSAVSLPTGSTGLMATLTSSLEKFHSAISTAQQRDLAALGTLGTNLATAGTRYLASDDNSANALSAASANTFGDKGAPDRSADSLGASRFSGLQLPSLPEVQENQYAVRQVVTAGIELISPYDEPLSRTIGIKPAADYLSPLVADWEALQAIGKRIGLLGINDYVASENLVGGSTWLQRNWSGDAAQAFGAMAGGLGQSVAGRSSDLDAVSKIVENGAACLERLVYNQAMGLSGGLAQSMKFLGFTLPLGVWAQLIDKPMQGSMRAEIISAVDTLKKSADSRQNAMTTIIERFSQTLDYTPGRAIPSLDASEFELPEKVVVDLGVMRYGFGNNVWWESSIASAT